MGFSCPRRRTRQQCWLWSFVVFLAFFAYYVAFPFVVDKFALPLFCDENSPCQNLSVAFYSLPTDSLGSVDNNNNNNDNNVKNYAVNDDNIATCKFSRGGGHAIVVLVLTREAETERRRSIRASWGKALIYRRTQVATFFLVAREKKRGSLTRRIVNESTAHGDMIFADMVDSYKNLTLKVAHGLAWADKFCRRFDFLVKVDSDVFFNPFPLVDYFYDRNLFSDPDLEFVGGSICSYCRPRRNFFDQWAISVFIYPHPVYPDYTHGPCYVISRKTVGKMLLSYPLVRSIPYEDVYFTGIMAGMYLKTARKDIPGFLGYSGRLDFDPETYATSVIASHKHDAAQIEEWWGKVADFRRSHNLL